MHEEGCPQKALVIQIESPFVFELLHSLPFIGIPAEIIYKAEAFRVWPGNPPDKIIPTILEKQAVDVAVLRVTQHVQGQFFNNSKGKSRAVALVALLKDLRRTGYMLPVE